MYAQLGNIIFTGLLGFESFSSTDGTTFAQHDLIGLKPILQATGNELEELAITIHLNAEFIKPEQAHLALKKAKDAFEVLPLLMGSGRFRGNYVITQLQEVDNTALPDGSITDMTLSLTLKEYAQNGKLQQQQVAARKAAFACGDIKPTAIVRPPEPTLTQQCAQDVSAVQARADVVDAAVSEYPNNVSARPTIETRLQSSLAAASDRLTQLQARLASLPAPPSGMLAALTVLQGKISEFTFPVPALSNLQQSNEAFQASLEAFKLQAAGIINQVITRAV